MKIIKLSIIVIFLSSCAKTDAIKPQSELMKNKEAVVIGYNTSFISSLIPLGSKLNIRFMEVDKIQQKSDIWDGLPSTVVVKEGKRELKVSCFGQFDSVKLYNPLTISLDAEAGRKYLIKPYLTKWGCEAKAVDITDKQS